MTILYDARRPIQTPDGRSLDVYLAGPEGGMPLLFVTGTPTAGIPSSGFVETLAERGMRYISFSRPGYGSSTRRPGRSVADVAEDAATVLDYAGADRFHLIGWSGGGPHALAIAALMPERVIAAATIGGIAPYRAEGLDYLAGMGAENIEEFNAAIAGPDQLIPFKERETPALRVVTGEQVADLYRDLIDDVDRAALTGEFAEWNAAEFRQAVSEGYWGWFDDDLAFVKPWGFDLASITVPVFVWQGGHDRMVPYAHGEWLAAHIPTARPRLFPELGHLSLVVDYMPRILDELLSIGR
jgi:pimeloyl-ACP methyl ester carboxylesterase